MADEAGLSEQSRKRWHPVLVDGLRYLLGDSLRIEPEHSVSALPTRIDVLVLTPEPAKEFDAPYHLLAPRTLIELVTPGDWATWRRLRKLYVDVGLYSLDQDIEKLENIGLWLVASRMSEGFLDLARRELGSLDHTEPGIYKGSSHGSPVVLIHLHELPLSVAAIPLLMVYRGPRENDITKFIIDNGQTHRLFAEQVFSFHPHAVKEVLDMLGMSREAFRQLANARDIIDLFGPRLLIEEMGEEEVIRTIGEEEFIRTIGEEEVIRTIGEEEFIRTIGEDRIREILDRMAKERQDKARHQP